MLDVVVSQNRGCARTVAWVLLALGTFFFACLMWNQFRLAVLGKVTDGIVVKPTESAEQQERIHRRGNAHRILVRYTPEGGEPVEFRTSSTFGTELNWGDPVKVIYLPGDLMGAEIYTARQLWLPMTVGLIVSLACLGAGALVWLILRTEGA